MKRILLISVLLVIAVSLSFSQIAYKKGDQVGSVMFGLGSFVYTSNATGTVPPLSVAYDFGFNENISFGGLVGYTASKWEDNYGGYGATYKWSYIIIGARGAYHYDLLHNDNIDTYGGLMLAYNISSSSTETTGNWPAWWTPSAQSSGGFLFSCYVGARYYFTPNLAAQAEVGFGLALLNIGVAYKF
jgi:hypothetical protein